MEEFSLKKGQEILCFQEDPVQIKILINKSIIFILLYKEVVRLKKEIAHPIKSSNKKTPVKNMFPIIVELTSTTIPY